MWSFPIKLPHINGKKPQQVWNEYEQQILKEKSIFSLSGEAEMGNAGEQPNRNILMDGNETEGENINPPSAPINQSSLSDYAFKNSKENEQNNLNSFVKSVQLLGG